MAVGAEGVGGVGFGEVELGMRGDEGGEVRIGEVVVGAGDGVEGG